MTSSQLFGISTMAYIMAMIVYIIYLALRTSQIGIAATTVTITGFVFQTIGIFTRWSESFSQWTMLAPESSVLLSIARSAPLRNLFESLIFFVWCLILGYLIIEFKYKNRSFGAFVTPIAGISLAFIALSGVSQAIEPLVPALKSNWLLAHVMMSFIAYAAFALSFSAGLIYLTLNSEKQEKKNAFWIVASIYAILLGLTSKSPETIFLWLLSFALVIVVDIKLNFDIAGRILTKPESKAVSVLKTALTAIGLSLISIAAIFIFVQLVKLQIIKADEAAQLRQMGAAPVASSFKGSVMGIVGLLLFVGIVFIKYLILKKEYYLFWTFSSGVFLVVFLAMGIDFLKVKVFGTMPAGDELKNHIFKTTFMSASPFITVLSYIAAMAALFAAWRYGETFQKIIKGFAISSDTLDYITYKTIAIGFPVFTLGGLIFGAIWADQAWGTYWGWDPKETWSLITWFVYAFFLHSRLLKGWKGKKVAVVSVIGFMAVIFTYLGVNLLLSGLHAYGSLE